MEKEGEPGSARFGNFINYYHFNPPERRLGLIPATFMEDLELTDFNKTVHVLDIGCNAGNLTENLYEHFSKAHKDLAIKILGVDLDGKLISRCVGNSNHRDNITYKQADVMTDEGLHTISEYMDKNSIKQFTLVTCFSVTMWVHLNHGDSGLQQFLSHVSNLCSHLLIEPQPWVCYKNACRRMQKLDCEPFPHYKTCQWRNEVDKEIETFLKVNCSMEFRVKYGLTAEWKRPVCLFSRVT